LKGEDCHCEGEATSKHTSTTPALRIGPERSGRPDRHPIPPIERKGKRGEKSTFFLSAREGFPMNEILGKSRRRRVGWKKKLISLNNRNKKMMSKYRRAFISTNSSDGEVSLHRKRKNIFA